MAPDLSTFGKVIGGGLPVGAFGGRAEIMDVLAPLGPVYQAGTLSGNPLATAAGLAALGRLTPEAYAELTARVERFAPRLEAAIRDAGLVVRVPVVGTLVGLFFGDGPAGRLRLGPDAPTRRSTPRSSTRCSTAASPCAPGAYEVLFVGMAHTDAVLDEVVARRGRRRHRRRRPPRLTLAGPPDCRLYELAGPTAGCRR